MEIVQDQYIAAHEQNKQIAAETHQLQQKLALLQSQHAATVKESQHIAEERQQLRRKWERIQIDLQHRTEVASIAKHSCKQLLQNLVYELRHQSAAQLQAFQGEVESYKTQLSKLTQQPITDTNRVAELVKLEAFDLWI